jgi:hypothetical protein
VKSLYSPVPVAEPGSEPNHFHPRFIVNSFSHIDRHALPLSGKRAAVRAEVWMAGFSMNREEQRPMACPGHEDRPLPPGEGGA